MLYPYIFGITAAATILGFLLELLDGDDKNYWAVLATAISAFVANWLIIMLVMPSFAHILTGGWPLIILVNLGIAAFWSGILHRGRVKLNGVIGGISLFTLVLIIWGAAAIFSPPAWCATGQIRERIALLDIQPANAAYPETNLKDIIRVPESVALTKAGNRLSSGETAALGSFAQPARAYIQTIQGKAMYAVDLKITDRIAYHQYGDHLPGYLLVDATDDNVPAQPQFNYPIKYAPEALFANDLNRLVYADYALGSPYQIWDLDGMEVDEDLNPYYVGNMMDHVMGYKGIMPAGVYIADPLTREGKYYSLLDVPSWVNRLYPIEWFVNQLTLWGLFSKHDACTASELNKEKVDWYDDVATPHGVEYQFAMTSTGDDPAMTRLIVGNPTTGKAVIYDMQGRNISSIMADIEKRAENILKSTGHKADECEIHRILNTNTLYCILTTGNDSGTSTSGYAFVSLEASQNQKLEDIALAESFDEAYFTYQEVLDRIGKSSSVENTREQFQIVGRVRSNTWVNYGSRAGTFLIHVVTEEGQSLYVSAPGNSFNAAIAKPGKDVTATVYQLEGQNFLTVSYITVNGEPDLDTGK